MKRHLTQALTIAVLGIAALALSAPSALATGMTWGPAALVDHQSPFVDYSDMNITCVPSSTLCVGSDGRGALTSTSPTGGFADWQFTPYVAFGQPSCPLSSFCAAGDGGNVVTSTNPTGGTSSWQTATIDTSTIRAISCPSESLCVAVDDAGNVLTSNQPTGGASKWTKATLESGVTIERVSCPSESLCVAVDDNGNVWTSTQPTGGASKWTKATIDSGVTLFALSCAATTTLCVTGDTSGNLFVTTEPTGGASKWTTISGKGLGQIQSISCQSASLCVAVDDNGDVAAASTPSDPTSWSSAESVDSASLNFGGFDNVSCSSQSLCVATDAIGSTVTSTDPTGGASQWTVNSGITGVNQLVAASCPSTSLCAAIDDAGNVFSSVNPTAGRAATWTAKNLEPAPTTCNTGSCTYPLTSVSCASQALCVVGDSSGNVWDSENPTSATPTWTESSLGIPYIFSVSCAPSSSLCVAVDGENAYISTNPSGGVSTWKTSSADPGNGLAAVSCPSTSLCVAVDFSGNVVTTQDPEDGASATWTSIGDVLGASSFGYNLSCPTTSLCVASTAGEVASSTDPAGGKSQWKVSQVYKNPCTIVECFAPSSLSCASAKLCVEVDPLESISSTDPAGGAGAWTVTQFNGNNLEAVACLSQTSLCMAMDNSGYIYLGTPASVGGAAPVNVKKPVISGPGRVGATLSCSTGTWKNNPTHFAYQWARDGTQLQGQTHSTYKVQDLDEGSTLTCTVTASNAFGHASATSSGGFKVKVPVVKGCPPATGSVHGTTIGQLSLGMTRAHARKVYSKNSTRHSQYEDFFCLTPRGIRDGYPSPKLLRILSKSLQKQVEGRVVWISVANPFYAVDGIRSGATLQATEQRLPGGNLFHIGLNYWYLAPDGPATAEFKVRGGIVQEIGLADKRLTTPKSREQVFLNSFF